MDEQKQKNFRPNLSPEANKPKKTPKFSIYWIYGIIIILLLSYRLFDLGTPETVSITSLDFKNEMLAKGDVKKIDQIDNAGRKSIAVYIFTDSLEKPFYKEKFKNSPIKPKEVTQKGFPLFEFKVADFKSFDDEMTAFYAAHKDIKEVPKSYKQEGEFWGPIANIVVTLIIIVVFWVLMMRKMGGGSGSGGGAGGIFSIGKSRAQLFEKGTKVNINFGDVAGLDEAKVEVMEIVDFLKNPKKYTALGGKIPKGALLVGPPGTGKTLISKSNGWRSSGSFF
jgi:AFG3 family protein